MVPFEADFEVCSAFITCSYICEMFPMAVTQNQSMMGLPSCLTDSCIFNEVLWPLFKKKKVARVLF